MNSPLVFRGVSRLRSPNSFCIGSGSTASLTGTFRPLNIGHRKRTFHLPTIQFQENLLLMVQKSGINSPVEVGSWNPIIYRVLYGFLYISRCLPDFWTINSICAKLPLFLYNRCDGKINPTVRVLYTHYKDSLFKGGMTIPQHKELIDPGAHILSRYQCPSSKCQCFRTSAVRSPVIDDRWQVTPDMHVCMYR